MLQFETLQPKHWPEVKRIYEEGILTQVATFETQAPDWEAWDRTHVQRPRLVVKDNGLVVGWAALSPVSGRCVYAGVAEVSIYIAASSRGKGLGSKMLEQLVRASELNDFWTLQAGIFPENLSSINIHEQNGFRKIGVRQKIAKLNGQWRDTLLFERRSAVVGV